jgi:hypothetical protein
VVPCPMELLGLICEQQHCSELSIGAPPRLIPNGVAVRVPFFPPVRELIGKWFGWARGTRVC